MNKIMKSAMVLSLCMASIFAAPLSLRDAQQIMFESNLDMATAKLEQKRNESAIREAKALWYPSVDLLASYSATTKKPELTMESPAQSATINLPAGNPLGVPSIQSTVPASSRRLSMGDYDKVETGVDVTYAFTQALVNVNNVKYRIEGVKVKDAVIAGLKNQLSFKLGMLYLAWDLSYRNSAVQDTLVRQLEQYRGQIQDQQKGGVAAGGRVLEAEARLSMARFDALSAHNTSDSLQLEVLTLLGSSDTSIVPTSDEQVLDSTVLNAAGTQHQNMNRPEIRALDLGAGQLQTLEKIQGGQKYPNLVALAGYRYSNPGLNPNDDKFMDYGILGLQVRWNIFDGFRVRSQRDGTREGVEALLKNRENLVAGFERSRRQTLIQLSKTEALAAAASASVSAAERLVADIDNSIKAGVATEADRLNAISQLARARLAKEQAEFSRKMGYLQLRYSAGEEIKY